MKVAIFTAKEHIKFEERPIPELDENKVLVKIKTCGICGSDVAAFKGSGHKIFPYSAGHEFCGIVEKMGNNVSGFMVGQRVVINPNINCDNCYYCIINRPNLCDNLKTRPVKSNGGFAEFTAVDFRMLHSLPDEITDETGTFIEPFSCAIHAAQSIPDGIGTVAVFGGGIMGILTTLALKVKDKIRLVVIEPNETRRQFINEILGITCLSPENFGNSVENVGCAIECSGKIQALVQGIRKLQKGGHFLLTGLIANNLKEEIPWMEITQKEIEIKGIWLNPNTFTKAVEMTHHYRAFFSQFKTKIFSLAKMEQAIAETSNPEIHKIIIKI